MNVRDQTRLTFVTSFSPFCDCTSKSLFTDHKISGRPIKTFQNICGQTLDNSPTDPISSLNGWSSRHGVSTLCNCWFVLFASSQYLSTHFFAWPSMSQDHQEIYAHPIFRKLVAFQKFLQKSWVRTYFGLQYPLVIWLSRWVQSTLVHMHPRTHRQPQCASLCFRANHSGDEVKSVLRRIQRAVQSPLLRTVLRDGSDTNFHEAGGQGGEPTKGEAEWQLMKSTENTEIHVTRSNVP